MRPDFFRETFLIAISCARDNYDVRKATKLGRSFHPLISPNYSITALLLEIHTKAKFTLPSQIGDDSGEEGFLMRPTLSSSRLVAAIGVRSSIGVSV